MLRLLFGMVAFVAGLALIVSPAVSQPPGGKDGKGKDGKGGPPRFELGQVFPPPLLAELKLTPEQEKELDAIRKDLKTKLDKLLTDEQKKTVENFRPRGPGGPEPRPIDVAPLPAAARLNLHGSLKPVGDEKAPFVLTGDTTEGLLGDARLEHNGSGIRFLSGEDLNKDGVRAGSATCGVTGLRVEKGRWYRVRVRGLAQDDFAVEKDDLFIKVEFFKDDGKNPLDFIKKSIYPQVELERKSLADSGTNKSLGLATWRTYSINVRTPYAEVDTLKVSVGFGNGIGKAKGSEFWVSEVDISPIPDPADYIPPTKPSTDRNPPALKSLVKLGGRWYYDPRGGSKDPPKQFDHTNADRLYYLSDRLETPFVGNMSAWLRRGYLDRDGNTVEKDQFVPDAVVISFTEKHLVMKSKNLPNHPTAVFPDRSRFLDGNPNVIREQRDTWYIPLEPKPNPTRAAAMTMENKRGLPMGPIGVAVNGVVFFNPFDHITEADAVWRLDRCCGHPSPSSEYHYHKYPVCVNTPWADDGSEHSPLIGFAFDGFPVYGPYESKGLLAKDSKDNPLNEYNLHEDDARGPHYHVTPGKFPHIIGGYWGEMDPNNRSAKKGPPKK
ncbi:MAG: YHYH protein [Planctomycetes bacterium]|nr:YHYH protein [Planctomycetota bacterium]